MKLKNAIELRLHGRNVSYVFELISETAEYLGLQEVAGLIGRAHYPGWIPVSAMRTAFAQIVENLIKSKGSNGSSSKAYISSVPKQDSTYAGK